MPGYRSWPFVTGWLETRSGPIPVVSTSLAWGDVLGRWMMRWGLGRSRYRVAPGLYAAGNPADTSPVLVSANYKLSFDALRRELSGLDAWILVLDTRGINVWCAAGKGTFGTDEIVRQVRNVEMDSLVAHRVLVVPQLGAPGVAAGEVAKKCGFTVAYGPVRAQDIRPFLAAGMRASGQMRRVSFTTAERLVLCPVELAGMLKPSLWVALTLLVLGGVSGEGYSLEAAADRGGSALLVYLAGLLAGTVVTPLLLPWVPGRAFAVKGALTGSLLATLFLALRWSELGGATALAVGLALPAVSSCVAMNFTGCTPFTSPSGVEKEMRRALPLQFLATLAAGIAWIAGGL